MKPSEDVFLHIASANKFYGYYKGIKVYTNPYIQSGIVYLIKEDDITNSTNKMKKTKKVAKKKAVKAKKVVKSKK